MSSINNISLYIPHVFLHFAKEYVAKAFKHIGEVSNIDFVAKQDRKGQNYNAVYVHFNKWYTNKKALAFYNSVVDDSKEARLCHDDHWHWIVLPNTTKKHYPGERKPTIDLGDSTSISTSTVVPKVCLPTPQKRSYADVALNSVEVNFDEVAAFEAEIEAELNEIDEMMDEEDEHLVKIDRRYVQQIEGENWAMVSEIMYLRAALINMDQMYNLYCN
jgi:hypothetical protein